MRYKIDPEVLARIAKEVVDEGFTDKDLFQCLRDRLAKEYPGLVEPQARCWMGSRAGGILGKMTLLYANMNEYLIIFGCPVGSQGFSGRYNFVEIWDFFLAGEISSCDLENGQVIADVYHAGDKAYLAKGHSLTCEIQAGSWMLEYGRGPTITALPFALMDSLLSSVELRSFYLTLKEYSHFVIKALKG